MKKMFSHTGLLACLIVLSTCSLEAKKDPTIHISMDPGPSKSNSSHSFESTHAVVNKSIPGSINDFVCLAFNVVGPGIGDSSLDSPDSAEATGATYAAMRTGNSCSYRGIVGGPFLKTGGSFGAINASVSIPSGTERIIQVVGSTNQEVCDSNFQSNTIGVGQSIYEVARQRFENVFSSRSIQLTSPGVDQVWDNYMAEKSRVVDCDLPMYPGFISQLVSSGPGIDLQSTGMPTLRRIGIKLYNSLEASKKIVVRLILSGPVGASVPVSLYGNNSTLPGTVPGAANVSTKYVTLVSVNPTQYSVELAPSAGNPDIPVAIYWIVITQPTAVTVKVADKSTPGSSSDYATSTSNTGGGWAAYTDTEPYFEVDLW